MVLREAATSRARIVPPRRVEGVAGFAVVDERVAQHQTVARRELMIDLRRRLSFGARHREGIVGHSAAPLAAIDRLGNGGSDECILARVAAFLLEAEIVEGAIFDERSAAREA